MKRLAILALLLLLLMAAGHLACHNDQRMTDQHRQILEDEDD